MASRILLSRDEDGLWYLRRVALVEDALDTGMRAFWCDEHLGGPFKTLAHAAVAVAAHDGPAAPSPAAPSREG